LGGYAPRRLIPARSLRSLAPTRHPPTLPSLRSRSLKHPTLTETRNSRCRQKRIATPRTSYGQGSTFASLTSMNSLRSPLTACAPPLNHRCRLQRNAGPLSHQRNVRDSQGGTSGAPYGHASRRRGPKGIQERRGRRGGKTEGHTCSEWARQGAKFDHTDTSHVWARKGSQIPGSVSTGFPGDFF
jgi:hypothetical protein